MFETGQAPRSIVEAKNLAQVSDEGYLEGVVAQILNDNPKEVASYLAGKETVFQWMMGQVARLTGAKPIHRWHVNSCCRRLKEPEEQIIFLSPVSQESQIIRFVFLGV